VKPDPSTRSRSIAKAVTWETFSNLVCFGLAYAMFGNFGGCAVFTAICFVVKLILFYEHERIWHQVGWGKRE
jgi:uncharacterized membrane protein